MKEITIKISPDINRIYIAEGDNKAAYSGNTNDDIKKALNKFLHRFYKERKYSTVFQGCLDTFEQELTWDKVIYQRKWFESRSCDFLTILHRMDDTFDPSDIAKSITKELCLILDEHDIVLPEQMETEFSLVLKPKFEQVKRLQDTGYKFV